MLFFKTIEPQTLAILKRLQELPELADTRLAGGTALALQIGHRSSVDLDVFGKWDYSKDLRHVLSSVGQVEKASGTPDGRMAFFFIDGVKVDFVSYEMACHPSHGGWCSPCWYQGHCRNENQCGYKQRFSQGLC